MKQLGDGPNRGHEGMNAIGPSAGLANVIPIVPRPVASDWKRIARDIGASVFQNSARYDAEGAFPVDDIAALQESGLLSASLPREFGGGGLSGLPLCDVLRAVGSGSLPLGRIR